MKAVRGRLSSLLVDFFFGLRDLGPEVIGGRGALVTDTHGQSMVMNIVASRKKIHLKNVFLFITVVPFVASSIPLLYSCVKLV